MTFIDINSIFTTLLEHAVQISPKVLAPCPICQIEQREANPTYFTYEECEKKSLTEESVTCSEGHEVPICELVPEVTLQNLNSKLIDFSQVVLNDKIGQGGFACVFKASYRNTDVAVKVLIPQTEEAKVMQQYREFRSEVGTMVQLDHPNIMALKGFSLNPPTMVLELILCGDLSHFLNDKPHTPLDWLLRLRIAMDMALGLSYLHAYTPTILHLDFKTPNVMLRSLAWDSKGPVAKICDFGVSKQLLGGIELKGQQAHVRDVANPSWLAPEVLLGQTRGAAVDIYAYGIILWELLCREHPWPDYTYTSDHEKDIISGVRPTIPTDCPDDYSALIKACWGHDPKSRPTAASIVEVFLPRITKAQAPELAIFQADQEITSRKSRVIPRTIPTIRSQSALSTRARPKLLSAQSVGWKKTATQTIRIRWQHHVTEKEEKLDCTYLKQLYHRLFIMPYPASMTMVNLLSEAEAYAQGYAIYNLTGKTYDYTIYSGQVFEYALSEGVPSFGLLNDCIASAVSHIQSGVPVILHDVDMSTGASVLVCAGIFAKLNISQSPHAAVTQVTKALERKSTLQPDHTRFLGYLFQQPIPNRPQLHLHKITWNHVPNFKFTGGCDPHYHVATGDKKFFFRKNLKGQKGQKVIDFFTKDILCSSDSLNIEFFHKDFSKPMFHIALNLAYEKRHDTIVFRKKDIPQACSDTKHFHNDFQIELHFLTSSQLNATLLPNAVKGVTDEWEVLQSHPLSELSYQQVVTSWDLFKADSKLFSSFFVTLWKTWGAADKLALHLDDTLGLQRKGKFILSKVEVLLKIAAMNSDVSHLLYSAGVCHYIWKIPPSAYKTFATSFCSSLQQTFPEATPELIEAWKALILHASHKMDRAFNYTKGDSFQVTVYKGKWKPTTLVVHADCIVYNKGRKKVSLKRDWSLDDIPNPSIPEADYMFHMVCGNDILHFATQSKKDLIDLKSKIEKRSGTYKLRDEIEKLNGNSLSFWSSEKDYSVSEMSSPRGSVSHDTSSVERSSADYNDSEDEGNDSNPNPFSLLNQVVHIDPDLPLCAICKKNVTKDQTCLTLSAGVMVHHTCMHCERCGVTFLEGCESVLQGGRVLCAKCDEDFYPACVECGKAVKDTGINEGAMFWHGDCFKCSRCTKPITLKEKDDKTIDGEVVTCKSCRTPMRGLVRTQSVVLTSGT